MADPNKFWNTSNLDAYVEVSNQMAKEALEYDDKLKQEYLKRYPWATNWTTKQFKDFEDRALPISINGVVRTPLTYTNPITISKDTKTEQLHKQSLSDAKELRDMKKASEKLDLNLLLSSIPGLYPMFQLGADKRYNTITGENFTPYTLPAGISVAAEAVVPFIPEGMNYASQWAKRTFGNKANRVAAVMNLNIGYPKETEFLPYNVGWAPKQKLTVSYKSDSPLPLYLFNKNRYDVVNEGANPFGIWYLGLLGTPRITAKKANKARKLFSARPYKWTGELDTDKFLGTIGNVKDRSALSYQAELLGANGIIYNGIYDNGFDNNQIILSFKHPDNLLLITRAYKGGPRKSNSYEFFTTDPKYARNYGKVKPYYIYSRFPITTDTPLMGFPSETLMDRFVYDITEGKSADAIFGHDKITGEFPYTSKGDEIIISNPSQAKLMDESQKLTSLEREGIPKGERNIKLHGHDYSNPEDFGLLMIGRELHPDSNKFGKFIDEGSEASVFEDPNNPNMILKVNTDWRGSLQDFYNKYVLKRNRVPYQKPLIIRGITKEGYPVMNLEKVIPMTEEQFNLNIPIIQNMLREKGGFIGDIKGWNYMHGQDLSGKDIQLGDFQPGNIAFDSNGNIVFIDLDVYKKGGKLISKAKSGIHIKKENKGKFTKSAKQAGLSVLEHAKSVLNNPNATPLQKKRANFARNSAKWHKK